MSISLDALATMIDDFEQSVSGNAGHSVISVDLATQFGDINVAVARNKVITALRAYFVTHTGYVNVPALLMFCHTYDIKYANVNSVPPCASFTVGVGCVRLIVS